MIIEKQVLMINILSFKNKIIFMHYLHNGLILDLFGLWPLNLALGASYLTQPYWIIFPIRIIRLI